MKPERPVAAKQGALAERLRGITVCGLGVVTDAFEDVRQLADWVVAMEATGNGWRDMLERIAVLNPADVGQHDAITQYAIRAAHQALSMAGALGANGRLTQGEAMGLLLVSTWGTIDATVAYLDSMLDAEGRYASPRHFSRSVYSSIASLAAIHFGIHGPCETLCFPGDIVSNTVLRAGRLMRAKRCQRVLVIWAEQAAPIAGELAHLAVKKLHRKSFARYASGELGFGAVAAVLKWTSGAAPRGHAAAASSRISGGPSPLIAAVEWAASEIASSH